jgi:peptidoglycan biosynthesis protein MviN/MurJ (putative lipid II flippase)
MKKDILTTSSMVVLGKGLGFLIPFFIAAFFGMDRSTDAFFFAFGVVILAQMVLGNIFENAIVPYIVEERRLYGRVGSLVGSILVRTTAVLFILSVLLIPLIKPGMDIFVHFDAETNRLGYLLVLEMIPVVFFLTWSNIFQGVLNAYKVFYVGALSPAIRSLTVLLCIFLLKPFLGVHSIALGYVAGEFLRGVIGWVCCCTRVDRIKLRWEMNPEWKSFFKSALWQSGALTVLCSLSLMNQIMASQLGPGALSLFTYAERLRNVPFMLFYSGVLPVIFSYWANAYRGGSSEEKDVHFFRKDIYRFSFFAVLVSGGLFLFKGILTKLAFGHGSFPLSQLDILSEIFGWFAVSLIFDVLGLLCVRLLILCRQDRIYLFLAMGRVVATGFFNAVLMGPFGILGIAYSLTFVNALYALSLYLAARRHVPERAY